MSDLAAEQATLACRFAVASYVVVSSGRNLGGVRACNHATVSDGSWIPRTVSTD